MMHVSTVSRVTRPFCVKKRIPTLNPQVVIAQLLAWQLATGEVPSLNPGKGDNLLISDKKGNFIVNNTLVNV